MNLTINSRDLSNCKPNNKIFDVLFNIVREDIWPDLVKNHVIAPRFEVETYQIDRLAQLLVNDFSEFPEQILHTIMKIIIFP